MSLLPKDVHTSWNDFLNNDILELLYEIECTIGDEYSPQRDRILRFLETDFSDIKIIILGQDPYPEAGAATGRAFEVGTLTSWFQPFRQVSLKNIIRLIYISEKGISCDNKIPTFSQIIDEIKSGNFRLAEPDHLFSNLEKQGVLFLNTYFTVIPGKPLSHKEIWQGFTERLLSWISSMDPGIIWFLWGKNAQRFKPFILNGKFYESRHPMMCSNTYADDFLKSDCIKKTMGIVNWTGL
ncbi:MAG: uracil-DNA glycosylase [Clostridiaceae bacterium]|jgi:uracil-DNA glycosylase|nr:uracil-DNA glycosylase [Clostridiaceae bacterium]